MTNAIGSNYTTTMSSYNVTGFTMDAFLNVKLNLTDILNATNVTNTTMEICEGLELENLTLSNISVV